LRAILAIACLGALLVAGTAGVADARKKDGKRHRIEKRLGGKGHAGRHLRKAAKGATVLRAASNGGARKSTKSTSRKRTSPRKAQGKVRHTASRASQTAGLNSGSSKGKGGGGSAGSPAQASAATATDPPTGDAPAAVTGQTASAPSPATSGSGRTAPRQPTSAGSAGGGGSGAFGGAGLLTSGLGAVSGDLSATDSRPARRDSSEGGERKPAPSSPIARTVRQVVEVIPTAIWALIGLLAALMLAFAGRSWLVGYRARQLAAQREELLKDVGLLQKALLPAPPEQLRGVMATAAYRPASGSAGGGDFYDVFALDGDRLGLVVGGLSSGGRRALGMTALIRHTLRAYLEAGMQPRSALQVGAGVLEHQLATDRASLVVGVYDRDTATLTYAGAGLSPPVVLGPAAFEPVTTCAPPPLGVAGKVGRRQTTLHLPPGSVVCFYTDGLTGARVSGDLFGYERLWRVLHELGPRADAQNVVDRVAGESDAMPDDAAACVLRIAHAARVPVAGGERRTEELELSRDELQGEAAGEFLAACGVPSDRIVELVEEFRATGARLGGAVLRVHAGAGVPEADLALCNVEMMHGVRAPARAGAGALA